MSKKKLFVSILVVILVLMLSACTPNTPNQKLSNQGNGQNKSNTEQKANTNANTIVKFEDVKVEPKEAYNTFTKKYPDAKVKELELEFSHGSYVYQVEGYDDTNEYEVKINPVDGKIMKENQEKNKDLKEGEITLENVNKIQDLTDQTLKDAGKDYKVEEWSLKSKNGQIIFNIEVVNDNTRDIEYQYDINTGKLIEKD
ncbi:MAG: hypothetical protein GX923_06080 [Clostridia bacterium]|nr:hypothetical protein [Clostridia bacterium]